VRHQIDLTPMTVLTQSLLSEKNNEIDELTAEVEHLSAEIERLRAGKTHQLHGTLSSAEVLYWFSLFDAAWFRVGLQFMLLSY